jgi:hypothetical protein
VAPTRPGPLATTPAVKAGVRHRPAAAAAATRRGRCRRLLPEPLLLLLLALLRALLLAHTLPPWEGGAGGGRQRQRRRPRLHEASRLGRRRRRGRSARRRCRPRRRPPARRALACSWGSQGWCACECVSWACVSRRDHGLMGGPEAELHGQAAALAVGNVGHYPATAPLELEVGDGGPAGSPAARVEHARADAVEPKAGRRRRPRPVGAGDAAQVGDGRRRDVCWGKYTLTAQHVHGLPRAAAAGRQHKLAGGTRPPRNSPGIRGGGVTGSPTPSRSSSAGSPPPTAW